MRRVAAVWLHSKTPTGVRGLGTWLRRWAQWQAERLHAKTRRQTVERDKRLEKTLAFAGQAE